MPDMDWPLVGRADEVARIADAIRQHPGSALLQGDAGVGKTRLARAVAETLAAQGWHVEACIGSAAAMPIPFGALGHLLGQPPSRDSGPDLERMRREVIARADGGSLLLVVDDASHLDHGSMALVHRLATSRTASALLTRRAGEPGHDETLTALWKDGYAERFDVPPLTREAHDQLVTDAVGPVRAAGLLERLWQVTNGNPLFLRELLGASEADLEAWLAGKVTPAPLVARLTEIIGSKISQLHEGSRAALEAVAMAEPVSLDIIAGLSDEAALAELQERSLVALDRLGGVEHVKTVHPIYGATIRASLPTLRRRALAAALAEALITKDLPQFGDALRAALWLDEAHEPLPTAVAARAANEALARGDAPLAERLAATAAEHDQSASTLVVLGTALSVQRKVDEAREVLERALSVARDDERAPAALACSRHHAWVGRDFKRGAAVLEETVPTVSDADARSELRAELAFFSAAAGDAAGTVRIARDVLSDPQASPAAVLSALIHSTRARVMLGWFDGLEEELDRGESLAAELRASLPLALDQLANNRALWLRFVDLSEARRVSTAGYERSLREGGPNAMWSGTLAWLSIDAGDLDGALGLIDRAGRELERFDPFHHVVMHRALEALVHAIRGDPATARSWLERAGPLDDLEPRSRAWADRAAVWIASQTPERAAAMAVAAGARAEANTILTWGAALLYHEAVRLSHAHLAAEPLTRLAAATTAPLVGIMAEHAQAAAERDALRLARVAEQFEVRGSPLLAAETLAQAAQCSRLNGTQPALWSAQAFHLALACPGATTPALASIVSPLSVREWEITALAAQGESSPDIADRLYLSVRTVNNHLGAVYKKLGLSGRQELQAAFSKGKRPGLATAQSVSG